MSTVKRTALVTGGMGGLGQEIARALHDAGHQVLVTHSRSEADAQVWLKEQADAGYVFQGYHVDVADFESCQQMAQVKHSRLVASPSKTARSAWPHSGHRPVLATT